MTATQLIQQLQQAIDEGLILPDAPVMIWHEAESFPIREPIDIPPRGSMRNVTFLDTEPAR